MNLIKTGEKERERREMKKRWTEGRPSSVFFEELQADDHEVLQNNLRDAFGRSACFLDFTEVSAHWWAENERNYFFCH